MITKRDLNRVKPTTLSLFGVEIPQETIDEVYTDLANINELYETQAAQYYTDLAKMTLTDIWKRVEWSFDDTQPDRAHDSAVEAALWLATFEPFGKTNGTYFWNLKRIDETLRLFQDVDVTQKLSMYVMRVPMKIVYAALVEEDAKHGTDRAAAYLDWSVFMAITASNAELATYGTKTFRLDS